MSISSKRLSPPADASLDLELVAQRIVKLAEIATLDHLEALLTSQAGGMLLAVQTQESHPGFYAPEA